MQQGHVILFTAIMISAMAVAGCAGTSPVMNNTSASLSPTPAQANYGVNLTSTVDYLYISEPGCFGDNATITTQVYENGRPYAKAGVPVTFKLNEDQLATLGQTQVLTDDMGKASVSVTARQSKVLPGTYPYGLIIEATANGATGSMTMPMTRHETLSGKATDKRGDLVEGATVKLLFNGTGAMVRAPGNPTTTGSDGRYHFTCLPVDMGNIDLIVEKGSLVATLPVNFTDIGSTL